MLGGACGELLEFDNGAKHMQSDRYERVVFLRGFFNHPCQVGSIVPSSRFLERRVVELADVRAAKIVVELGAGTGGTTRAILRAMSEGSKLLSVEISPLYHAFLGRIQDDRLISHLGSADELRQVICHYGVDGVDAVISGIPFSTLNPASACRILEAISSALVPGGRFVAYQVRRLVETLCRPYFGSPRVHIELLNIPPLLVYRWEKDAKSMAAGCGFVESQE